MPKIQNLDHHVPKTRSLTKTRNVMLTLFSTWCFVLVGRPQDIFLWLASVRPALVLGLIVLLAFILEHHKYKANKIRSHGQVKLYLAFLAVMLLGVPFAYYRRLAFNFVTNIFLISFIFFIIFIKIIDSTPKIRSVIFVCCLSTVLYSGFALFQGGMTDNRLSYGSNFDPNDLAFFIVLFLPFNFLFVDSDNKILQRLISTANILISLLIVMMTGSRGGFVSMGTIFVILFLFRSTTVKPKYKIAFLLIGALAVLRYGDVIDFDRFLSLTDIGNDYNVFDETGRVSIWKNGITLMLMNPLTGVGVGCFNEAIGRYRAERGLQELWQAPHNSLVQVGAETGVIGLGIFMAMMLKAFRIFLKVRRGAKSQELLKLGEMAAVGFIGMFIGAMFLSQAYSIYITFYIALSAVLLYILEHEKRNLQETKT